MRKSWETLRIRSLPGPNESCQLRESLVHEIVSADSRHRAHLQRASRSGMGGLVRLDSGEELVGANRIHPAIPRNGSACRWKMAGADALTRWNGHVGGRGFTGNFAPPK